MGPWFDPWVKKITWGGNGDPLQYSCLRNSMVKGAWWAIVHGVTKSRPWLNTHTLHCKYFNISSMASKEYNHLVHLFKEAMSSQGVKLKKKKKFLLHDSAHFEETKSDWKFHFENLYIIEKQIIPLSVLCNRWTGHLANEIFFFSKKFIDWMELAKIYICCVC